MGVTSTRFLLVSVYILLLAVLSRANAIPSVKPSSVLDLQPRTGLDPSTYDCDVNILCGRGLMEPTCDRVINTHIWRSDKFIYNIGKWPEVDPFHAPCTDYSVVGELHAHIGCSMYIEGPEHCNRTGNQIWWDYQDIKRYGCRSCGLKTFGVMNECRVVVNHDSNCLRCWNQMQGPLPPEWPPNPDEPVPPTSGGQFIALKFR